MEKSDIYSSGALNSSAFISVDVCVWKQNNQIQQKDYSSMAVFVLCAETTTPSYNTVAWTPAVSPCERRKRQTTGLTLFKVQS